MIILPSVVEKSHPRPGKPKFEELYLVPDMQQESFWKKFYDAMRGLKIKSPITKSIFPLINHHHGYFGYRVHPVTHEPRYFHAGVSLELGRNREIFPVLPGILEYAGYGAVNGYYVLLSHPQIQTEDSYIFHSMYCHLKKPLVRFNSYEKMLREISLNSYPLKEIGLDTILGTASTSGTARETHPGLYLQFSFRKFGKTPIVVDPALIYSDREHINLTANTSSLE